MHITNINRVKFTFLAENFPYWVLNYLVELSLLLSLLVSGNWRCCQLYILDNNHWPFFVLYAFFLLLFLERATIYKVDELDDLLIGISL
jgi:hypothetical protein